MKIAYLTCVYPPYPGGIGMIAYGLGQEMSKRGYDIHIFTPKYNKESKNGESEKVFIHYIEPLIKFGNSALMPQLIKELKDFDIIHLLYPFFGVAELIGLIKKKSKAKIIVHHTMDAVAKGFKGSLFSLHRKTLTPYIFKKADKVISLSEDYFNNSDISKIGKNVEFIPNGINTEIFRPNESIKKERNIVFVGALDKAHYFKGVEVLIRAMEVLKNKRVVCKCQIIGDGDMKEEYEKLANDAGLFQGDTLVEFVGFVENKKVVDYYQKAVAVVVPATARVECFSITAAEAQASGIPAIVSDFPGARVTIENGVTGYVVKVGDLGELAMRIEELVENPDKAVSMGKKGRERAEKMYSWNVIGDKLVDIYKAQK